MESKLKVMLADLWEGPGHAYYSGPLATALASRADAAVGMLINRNQEREFYRGPIDFFSINAPTGAGRRQWGRLLAQPIEFMRVMRALSEFKSDVLLNIFNHPWFTLALPRFARRIAVVSVLHDVTPHHGENSLRNRMGLNAILNHSRAILVHGEHSLEEAVRRYPTHGRKFRAIPFGHTDELSRFARSDRAPDPATFLFFGRMLPYKGLEIALAGLEKVLSRYPQARLIVAGAGSLEPHRAAMQRLGANLEIVNRRVSDAELGGLMARSLAVLLPYTHASGSGVVSTASAFSRPVIASQLGGLQDMIRDSETGFLFNPCNADDLAEKMSRAIENPRLVIEMGRNARQFALTEGDWNKIAESLMQCFMAVGSPNPNHA